MQKKKIYTNWSITRIADNELYHHGIKGQKWGVRRYQNKDGSLTNVGKNRYNDKSSSLTETSPKIKDSNDDYIYKKGVVLGRYGKQKLDGNPMYLFTNKKDRNKYADYLGGEEQYFVVKKDIKMPSEGKQLIELYNYTKDPRVVNDPYFYWKDNINQSGKIADGYFKYMSEKGYDALVDVRNSGGVADDPILLLNPKRYLKEAK